MDEDAPLVLEDLTEDEAYLYAILSDPSGLDQAEFLWVDYSSEDNKFCPTCGCQRDGVHLFAHPEIPFKDWDAKYPAPSVCFRAWAFQWSWWRDRFPLQIDQCARSVGKSKSIQVRACAFPFLFPGQEMVVTAPELVHLEPIVSLIETQLYATRLLREMVVRGKGGVTHRPFQANFTSGARIIGRIPQRDGKGVKGIHPIWLEQDECLEEGTLVLTERGQISIEQVAVGDRVWTHRDRWMPVTATFDRGIRDTINVRGQGHLGLRCTPNHPFWVRPIKAWTSPQWRQGPQPGAPGWRPAEKLTDTFWASPRRPLGVEPPPSEEVAWRQPDFLWLLGLFAAEGALSSSAHGELDVCCWSIRPEDFEEIGARIKRVGFETEVWPSGAWRAAVRLVGVHEGLVGWLDRHVGQDPWTRSLPSWVYSLDDDEREQILNGITYRGTADADRCRLVTASKALAVSFRLLAQSCGYHTTLAENRLGRKTRVASDEPSFLVVCNRHGHSKVDGRYHWSRVLDVENAGPRHVYDIEVDKDHSFVADGVVVHNSQDYPHAGWVELRETLKRGFAGATWRAHGVTKGIRDDFYESTLDTPDNPWKVHRFSAMWRPNWTDAERQEAFEKYGSREDPDYRRNILGLHGDKTNPIFVLSQLMKNVDSDPVSAYNTDEYFKVKTKIEQLEMFEQTIADVLDFPAGHLSYAGDTPQTRRTNPKAVYWIGMDVGFTLDPSEILVFVEYRERPKDQYSRLKLLTRISMARMPHRDQLWAILHTIEFYRPRAFAMDKTGLGLPLFQELQEYMDAFRGQRFDEIPAWMRDYDLDMAVNTVKGYNFSEKLIVDFDSSIEVSDYEDPVNKAAMRRNAVEYATDVLREMVDRNQLWLPWDDELLKQFQGGTWTSSRSMDAYGRRSFSKGNDHCLDAARMMALGWAQHTIEEMLRDRVAEPVLDVVVTF